MSGQSHFAQSDIQALYSEQHGWLHDWLRRRLDCSEQAADLVQDTFVRVLTKDAPPVIESPRAYLSTVAKGLLFNLWRRQALEQAYLDALSALPEAVMPSEEARYEVFETLLQLSAMLDGLCSRDKRIFVLARIDGMKYQQIADELDLSLNTVQKSMQRILLRCYRYINEQA